MSILGDIVGVVEDAGKWTYNTITHGANQLIPGSGPFKQVSWKGSGSGSGFDSDYLNAAAAGQLGGPPPTAHHAPAPAAGGGGGGGTNAMDVMMMALLANLLKGDTKNEPAPPEPGQGLSGTILTNPFATQAKRRRTYLRPQVPEETA